MKTPNPTVSRAAGVKGVPDPTAAPVKLKRGRVGLDSEQIRISSYDKYVIYARYRTESVYRILPRYV